MIKWTEEKCYEVAKECNSRGEYKKKYPCAYCKSLKKRWINTLGLLRQYKIYTKIK